jgi:glutaredoxin
MSSSKKITVYTTTTCAYCPMVKRWLDGKKIAYKTINLDEEPHHRADIVKKSGAMTVPITLVQHEDEHEDVVVGFNLMRLSSVLGLA